MKKDLIKLANHLDTIGLTKEADYVDALLVRYAQEESDAMPDIPDEIILDDGIFNNEEARMLKDLSDEALSEELTEPDDKSSSDIPIPPEPPLLV